MARSCYLTGVPIDQIEELVNRLLAPIQIEANAFVSSSGRFYLSEDEEETRPAFVQMSEPASTTALLRADASEIGTPPHAIATKDPESGNEVEFEDEELQGDDALLELFMRCDVFEPAEKPPFPATPELPPYKRFGCSVKSSVVRGMDCKQQVIVRRSNSQNVAKLQMSLDAPIDACTSPSSVLDFLPLIQRQAAIAV